MINRNPINYIFIFCAILLLSFIPFEPDYYPIDGYKITGIRRLAYLEKVKSGEIVGNFKLPQGALKSYDEIKLNLLGQKDFDTNDLPEVDADLQKSINTLFPNLDESYSISLVDITKGKKIRYAKRQDRKGFQPGSVGKLAVIIALFDQLQKRFPNSFEKRLGLLKNTMVRAGKWAIPNEHIIPFYDPDTGKYFKRVIQEGDVFSLFEWADHMLSVSSNGAASVVWREIILMDKFGSEYPVSEERVELFFKNISKSELSALAIKLVNDPLRELKITEDEWRLGSLFTRGATNIVPRLGGSIGTPAGLMKFLISLERGMVIDQESSLEIKRLLLMTDKRIRYAAASVLSTAAVYFKSGSLYSCEKEEGFTCTKYHGNVMNYMNSVAIIEHTDGTTYLVVLMSNVLKKNSSGDHYSLATRIDKLVRK